jgi:hypothetical protein
MKERNYKMTKTKEKTVLRDSGNGQFISRRKAARKPRNTWQQEQVPVKHPKRQARMAFITRKAGEGIKQCNGNDGK